MDGSRTGRRTGWPRWADPALAVGALLVGLAGLAQQHPAPPAGVFVGATVMCSALAWRRAAPVTVLLVVVVAIFVQQVLGHTLDQLYVPLTLFAGSYSVGAHRRPLPGLAGQLAAVAVLALGTTIEGLGASEWLYSGALSLAAWAAGAGMRARIGAAVEAENRAVHAEQRQRQAAEEAVTAERARIARELHDVVSHSVGIMVMQAGALRRVLGTAQARESGIAGTIERTGREALVEMRRMLHVLREDDGPVLLSPQPGLDRIGDLVAAAAAAGLPVSAHVDRPDEPLPPGLDLCAFRIVQESLTNVAKHAGPTSARVEVRVTAGSIEVAVTDEGPGGRVAGVDGQGLLGMRERVALFGGQLAAGPRAGGGFEVRATLPRAVP